MRCKMAWKIVKMKMYSLLLLLFIYLKKNTHLSMTDYSRKKHISILDTNLSFKTKKESSKLFTVRYVNLPD